MRAKHYPNIYRMRTANRKLVGALNALDLHGIEPKQITLNPNGTPVIEVHHCSANYKLHGVPYGSGMDQHGHYVCKAATVNGCKVTWIEDKTNV